MKALDRTTGDSERGAVAIFVALFLVVAMILLAFVVDRGQIYVRQSALQNAVDAAALAGAKKMCVGDDAGALASARQYAILNGISSPRITGPYTAGTREYINVRGSQSVKGTFASFAGAGDATVGVQATGVLNCRGDAFAIFAGTTFDINGGGGPDPLTDITGSIYAPSVSLPNNDTKTRIEGSAFYGSSMSGTYTSTGAGGAAGQVGTLDATNYGTPADYALSSGLIDAINGILSSGSETVVTDCTSPIQLPLVSTTILTLNCAADLQGAAATGLKLIRSGYPVTLDMDVLGSASQAVIVSSSSSEDGTPSGAINVGRDLTMYGSIYAPFGAVTTNGHGFTLKNGRLVVKSFRENGGNSRIGAIEGNGDPYLRRTPALAQ